MNLLIIPALALDLWNNEICDETAIEKLTTGCHHLDAALRGTIFVTFLYILVFKFWLIARKMLLGIIK